MRFGLILGFEWHERDGVRSYVSLASAQSDCGLDSGVRIWLVETVFLEYCEGLVFFV